MTSPTWYDLLDVRPDADTETIRGAWRSAVAGLDPTDRRFAVLNEAARVLLDPALRRDYDAGLAEETAATPPPPRAEDLLAPATVGSPEAASAPEPTEPGEPAGSAPSVEDAAPTTGVTQAHAAGSGRRVPGWQLVLAGVLAAATTTAAGFAWARDPGTTVAGGGADEASRQAQGVAVRAIVPVLSYDYRHLDEDAKAAESYLSTDYRAEYGKLFDVISQNAPTTKTVVVAQVIDSGITRTGDDRVDVLVFVNQSTTNAETTQPVDYKNAVSVHMVRVDGNWLIDGLDTNPLGG